MIYNNQYIVNNILQKNNIIQKINKQFQNLQQQYLINISGIHIQAQKIISTKILYMNFMSFINKDMEEDQYEEDLHEESEEPMDWKEQKKIWMKLAANSKELARVATEKLKQEQERHSALLKQKEFTWKTELEALKIENKILKSERSQHGLEKGDKFYQNLRTQLVEEIERLERLHKQKEEETLLENNNLQIEIDTLKESLLEHKKKEHEFDLVSKKIFSEMKSEYERAMKSLGEEIEQERSRAQEASRKLSEARTSLCEYSEKEKEKKFNYDKMQSIMDKHQIEIQNERAKMQTQIKQMEEINKMKLEEKDTSMKIVEKQLGDEIQALDRKYKISIKEKRTLDSQLKTLLDSCKGREELLEKSSQELQGAIDLLLSQSFTKENHVRTLIATLTKEFINLQKSFEEREDEVIKDLDTVKDKRKIIEDLIDQAHEEAKELLAQSQYMSVFEAQKKELELTLNKVTELKKDLVERKEKEMLNLNGTRKSITAAIEGIQGFIKRSKVTEKKLKEEFKNLANTLTNTNDQHNSEEEHSATQITNLSDELKKLRLEMRAKDAMRYEEQIAELQTAYTKAQSELEGNKKILMAHIDTINALEDRIKLRGESEEFDRDDEMVRIKMENLRLNAENASLLSAKQKMETYYTDEIEKLNAKFMQKRDDYDSLLNKYNNMQEATATKRLGELSAWKKRSENLRKTISSLEEKIEDLASKNAEILQFQQQQGELKEEELLLLRGEAKKTEAFWKTKQEEWTKELKELEDEISLLREKAKLAEAGYGKMTNILQEKKVLLEETRNHTQLIENSYLQNRILQTLKTSILAIEDWIKKQDEIVANADSSEIAKLTELFSKMEDAFQSTKIQQSQEIQMISETYSSRISILKEKEENALLEIEANRGQIELLKADISQLRSIQSRQSQLNPMKDRSSEIIRKQIALTSPVLNDSASEKASAHSSKSETRKGEKRPGTRSAKESKKGAK